MLLLQFVLVLVLLIVGIAIYMAVTPRSRTLLSGWKCRSQLSEDEAH